MKKLICRLLYHLVSWLADITGGFRPLVRCKLAVGTLLMGLTVTAGSSCGRVSCYDASGPEPTCYADTTIVEPPQTPDPDEGVTCYMVGPEIEKPVE